MQAEKQRRTTESMDTMAAHRNALPSVVVQLLQGAGDVWVDRCKERICLKTLLKKFHIIIWDNGTVGNRQERVGRSHHELILLAQERMRLQEDTSI